MNWTTYVVITAVFLLIVVLRRVGLISAHAAREHLKNGATVIDVRTPGEYAAGHLPNVMNLPLDGIETALPKRVPNKGTVMLLHCQSGVRSGVAKRKLQAKGYARAYNLGSLARARKVLGGR